MLDILELGSNLLIFFDSDFPVGVQGYTLLALRVGFGVIFVLHGYPKNIEQADRKQRKIGIFKAFDHC